MIPIVSGAIAMSAESLVQTAPGPTRAKSLKLREARFEDYSSVVALESKFHLVPKTYEDWTHLWLDNPGLDNPGLDNAACRETFPMGWVLQNDDGAVVGYLGNIPLSYEFEGARLLAATTRSWVVDTSYRTHALLLLATYFKQPNVDLFLNTTVNAQAAQAFGTFQGLPVPAGAWDRSLFWITHHRGFTESYLRKSGTAMARPLSYPLSAGLFLRDQFAGRRLVKNGSKTRVVACARFDERFDAFWAALRKKKFNLLLAVRTREALEWHFKFALLQNAAWIYTVEDSSGLLAYSVFVRQDNPETGLTRVRLADFQCLEKGTASAQLTAMLHAASDRCRQESIHMLELIGLSPELERAIEGTCPHRRQLPNWMYFYKANGRFLEDRLKSAEVWEPSLLDGDSTL
jgi:hypothetical protein